MNKSLLRNALGTLAAVGALHAPVASAADAEHARHDGHAQHRQAVEQRQPIAGTAASVRLEDAVLVDRSARPTKFRQDAIGDRIVAISFVYTSCTTVCPMITSVFADLQQQLGERLGRDVWLVSLSIDPATDTPQRLAEYAARFGAKPGWLWLTGDKQQMTQVLKGLGAYTPDFTSHPPMVLVGDGRTGRWVRFNGLPSAQQLVPELERLTMARSAPTPRAAR